MPVFVVFVVVVGIKDMIDSDRSIQWLECRTDHNSNMVGHASIQMGGNNSMADDQQSRIELIGY
jgi:hypothetical protein